ncbi:MAG: hypothetical protein NMK33_03365 [Candidatus Cardinium sp.]|uniref:hypothetical protein n=1 Tax=Cardinium endosymbiont of Dermatophagoides farinae TaxID=2597823 RepID=UPI00118300DE|nr:hypothetical protein [Cardinium endosymbiont of Dermatophagoides farinae]TSJ80516.1 hypothetical protein FPG78_00155 [Cardinium endosymbiont of Dermatophagoides farinae]UWW96481.1 MAG: hypothetical protein NMK33_03365 [Candidatus Cardinium sp.]
MNNRSSANTRNEEGISKTIIHTSKVVKTTRKEGMQRLKNKKYKMELGNRKEECVVVGELVGGNVGFATAAIITGLDAAGSIGAIVGSSTLLYALTLTGFIVVPSAIIGGGVSCVAYGGYKIYKKYKKRNKDCKRDPRTAFLAT